jgi:hypothetical protein
MNIENYIRKLRHQELHYIVVDLGIKFLQLFPYSNSIKEDVAISCYWVDPSRLNLGMSLLNELETQCNDDVVLFQRVERNKLFFQKKLNDISFKKHITFAKFNTLPVVTFATTTCKRLDLFIQSMNGFLENCLDKHLIHEWICIDDNSRADDVTTMKTMYPFLKIISKSWEQKGHPQSMQLITQIVKTPYLIYIEDDRMLINKNTYISRMIDVLYQNSTLGQICFNKNYTETVDDVILGGILKKTNNNIYYYEHEYCETETEKQAFTNKYGICCNCSYYPHFTLSPSLIKTSVFDHISFLDETMFEYKFGLQYTKKGYKTAFLPGFNIKHIGRLTSEINDITKFNAYDLVDTKQFQEQVKYKSFLLTKKSVSDNIPVEINRINNVGWNHQRSLFKTLLEDTTVDGYVIIEKDILVPSLFWQQIKRCFVVLKNKQQRPDVVYFDVISNESRIHETGILERNLNEKLSPSFVYYISKQGATKILINYDIMNINDNKLKGFYIKPPFV